MIVHVYNPERILNNTSAVKSNVNNNNNNSKSSFKVSQDQKAPPPSPKLLRQSGFKGFYSKSFQSSQSNENQSSFDSRCLGVKKQNGSRDKEAGPNHQQMDPDGAAMWANRSPPHQQQQQQQHHHAHHGTTPSPSSGVAPQGCTCQCGAGSGAEPANRTSPGVGQHDASAASSHYFTPAASFNCDEAKEPDSLEYRPVRDSPPLRKASLDRILSPLSSRRPMTSSPQSTSGVVAPSTPGSKPISPVSAGGVNNTTVHSSFSEDSLVVSSRYHHHQHHHHQHHHESVHHHHHQQQHQNHSLTGLHHHQYDSPFTSPTSAPSSGQRWNNIYEPLSGNWNAPEADQKRASFDFSKDSLNVSSERKIVEKPPLQPATTDDDQEESGSSQSEAVRLESLAFTIDFGDVTPVKKKETPKRFAERLTNPSSHSKRTTAKPPSDSKKQSESGTPGDSETAVKMLKSLTGRLGGPLSSPMSKYGVGGGGGVATAQQVEVEPHDAPRRPAPAVKATAAGAKGAPPGSRNSSVGRTPAYSKPTAGTRRDQLTRRSPSPTPPPSPVKSRYNSRPVKKQHSIESDDGGYEEEPAASSATDSNVLADSETAAETTEYEEADDAASETGTYTIGKDSPSIEEDQSRRDIERVFGLLPASTADPVGLADEGRTPQWIREWAAQVAQQQEAPPVTTRLAGLSKPPSHPRTQQEQPAQQQQQQQQQRPRRRLPSVPPTASNGSSRSRSSPRPSDMSDPSDSSLETECFLRDTESVVCAMQARVDGRSSADSDAETRSSASYRPVQMDLENSIGRKLSAQLRAKIRSLEYTTSDRTSSVGVAASVSSARKTTYVVSNNAPNAPSSAGSVSPSVTATNIIHNELHGAGDDAKSLHSDSSLSDITSGETSSRRIPLEDHKPTNAAPAVRYNRALSLRRGRLGLDVDQSASAPGPSPSSAKERRTNWTPGATGGETPSRGTSPHVPPSPGPSSAVRKLSTVSSQSQASAKSGSAGGGGSFSRNDGGRFSLRVGSKASTPTPSSAYKPKVSKSQSGNLREQTPTPSGPPPSGPPPPAASAGARKSRSNSTLTSKEAEFQNWKRRKNYDPMKAAAEGKKKEAARRAATLTMSQSMIGTVTTSMVSSPSSQSPSPPPRTIIRSASFTCVNNASSKGRPGSMDVSEQSVQQYNNNSTSRRSSHHKTGSIRNSPLLYSSDDEPEMLYSPPKKTSPKPSPSTSRKYMGLNLMHNSPPSLPPDFNDMASVTSNDVDLTNSPGSPRRKLYLEEGLLSRTSASNSSLRARTKLEALDNLVISTIHGLSSKIRVNAEALMRKLRPQYVEDMERLNMIDDTLNRLSECVTESPIHSVAGGRSSSRELSGTLKVMKRVEQVFQVLDQVLFEEVMDGGGEEGAILNDSTTTEGEDWNGYTSGDFY